VAEPERLDVASEDVRVNDMFSAGNRAAFHVTISGVYRGGLRGHESRVGTSVVWAVAGLATVDDGVVTCRACTDRLGVARQLHGS
jgi:hypothetical protein